ncbi:acyltransferase family protein [Dyadobacter crusticola]|uniref:acyltransferase family protein n=1 Tax=Dyadobacter crusticola TaxID=292407 RepID=UPI0004E175D5|nr:acyltransferase [Dyadobacter crusticola]
MDIKFKKGHVNSLDGIRGIAILLVLSFHCFDKIDAFPFTLFSEIGWVGVDLFFVLSGFLITGILVDTKGNQNYLKSFFAKRALRIFPVYYLTLLLVFLALISPGASNFNPILDIRHLKSSIYYLTFTQNLLFAFDHWGVTDLLNHFWSLAIEEQFYLFWPFVNFYLGTSKVLMVCGLLIIIAIIVRNLNVSNDFSYVFTLSRVDALGIGGMLAILIRKHSSLLGRIALPVFLASLVLLIILSFYSPDLSFRNPYFIKIGYTLFALLFATVIVFVYDTNKTGNVVNRMLSWRFLRFFGTYSYGLYIYHWLLYRGIYTPLYNKYLFSKAYILLFLIVVVLVSVVSYHTFEKLFLSYKSRFDSSPELTKAEFSPVPEMSGAGN